MFYFLYSHFLATVLVQPGESLGISNSQTSKEQERKPLSFYRSPGIMLYHISGDSV